MRRPVRIALIVLMIGVLVVVLVLAATHRALTSVDPFYAKALDAKPEKLEVASRELESRATALYNDAQYQERWSSVISADQINGWLARKLAAKQAGNLPPSVHNPRVAISPDAFLLGFEIEKAGLEIVVTVEADAFLVDSQSVGLRLVSVHAGSLPLPAKKIAEEFAAMTRSLATLRWTRVDGDPVAVFDFAAQWPKKMGQVHLDALELHDGEIYLAGHAQKSARKANGEAVASFEEPVQESQPARQPSDQ